MLAPALSSGITTPPALCIFAIDNWPTPAPGVGQVPPDAGVTEHVGVAVHCKPGVTGSLSRALATSKLPVRLLTVTVYTVVPPAARVVVALVLLIDKLAETVTLAVAVPVLLPGTGSVSAITVVVPAWLTEPTLAKLTNDAVVVPVLLTVATKVSVCVVPDGRLAIVQVGVV